MKGEQPSRGATSAVHENDDSVAALLEIDLSKTAGRDIKCKHFASYRLKHAKPHAPS